MSDADRILIVDDDPEICDLLAGFLRQHGMEVDTAADGEAMFDAIAARQPSLIVLDIMMPGEDGLSLCRKLSAQGNIPVIMLTAVAEEADRIVGLEMGADDYLSKPFNPRELLARIRAVLRRASTASQASGSLLCFGSWQLDPGRMELTRTDGTLVPLSSGEFRLLQVFAEHPQQVLSRDFLLERTHGRESGPYDRSVDIQLSRLRRKLGDDPKEPQLIKTVRSGGYLFSPPVQRK